jgi:hypothetical protein
MMIVRAMEAFCGVTKARMPVKVDASCRDEI